LTASKRLADCQRVIGYCFANPMLLEIALTHSSVRTPDRECNERQEFLGDSVLGLTITEELYKRLPDQQEGELTRIKSAVVSRGALYRVSTRLGLTRFVEVAKGVGRKEELPVSLTANLVESIIGAIYLDAGFFPAREFILKNLGPEVEDVMNDRVAKNYKSLLQHEAQQLLGATPIYRTVEEEGPDHRKAFVVAAVVRGTEYGRASGINKKDAEQEAARHALEALMRRSGRGRRRRIPETRDLRDGRDYRALEEPREASAAQGTTPEHGAAGDHGVSAERGEHGGRGDDRPRRGGRGPRGGMSRGRDARDDVRPLVAQSKDDAAWRAWAEGARGAPPPTPAAVPATPSAPYVVGPEPEEAYFDAPSDAGPIPVPTTTPIPPGALEGETTPSDGPHGSASASGPEGDDEPRGRRRRGRRGGAGRRGRSGPADGLDASGLPPASNEASSASGASGIAQEADPDADAGSPVPAAFVAPADPRAPIAPAGESPAEAPSWPDFGAEPAAPRKRAREPRRRGRSDGEAPPPRRTRAAPDAGVPSAPAPAPTRERASKAPTPPPPASPGFGAGVVSEATPPAPPPPRPVATPAETVPVVGVPAVRKAPRTAPQKPDGGGFGAGLA
jgi:ribonuclease III